MSLSVSTQKIKLVKISGDSKKVTKAVTFDIPPGLVEMGRVQKAPEFAALIKDIWRKERIREKTVGIVVPEFSTFMKAFTLPKLPSTELDEAVRWQAREFLPNEGRDMIMDWKIIDETDTQVEVLLVAIEVAVLSGFVGAIDAAGLLPVFVETTSLCLERLAESEKGKLVLYRSHGTAVVTVIVEKKIVATSVLSSLDDPQLLSNLLQILARYGRSTVTGIAVCGNGLTQEFVNALHTKTDLPIELLRLNVTGLNDALVQDYLIALSQQFIDAEEPSNIYSINLLPPSWVMHYKNQMRDLRLWTLTLMSSVVMWTALIALLAAYVLLSQRASETTAQKDTGSAANLSTVTGDITRINILSGKIDTVSKSFVYPQTIINLINSKKVEGVTITGYDINLETNKVVIGGLADTREHLLAYRAAVEEIKEFPKVSLPLANLLTETNISFSMQLDYKKQ